MKTEEVDMLLTFSNSIFDWSSQLKGATKYDKELEKDYSDDMADEHMWEEDDPAEVAQCIWEWWRIHFVKFTYFAKAIEFVVLVQVSSPPVERIFSQIRLIIQEIHSLGLHDNVVVHMMEHIK